MTDLRALLAPIRERLAAATPGPWETVRHDLSLYVESESGELNPINLGYVGNRPERDGELIANAPADLARLLSAIEAVESWCMNLDAIEAADPSSAEHLNSSAGAVANVIRKSVAAALGSDATNQEGTQ